MILIIGLKKYKKIYRGVFVGVDVGVDHLGSVDVVVPTPKLST